MRTVIRLLAAAVVGISITVAGVVLFEALNVGGVAWFGLLAVALLAVSLVDRERFYGISDFQGRSRGQAGSKRIQPHR